MTLLYGQRQGEADYRVAFLMGYFKVKLCVHLCISLRIETIHQLTHSDYLWGISGRQIFLIFEFLQ